ncbi:MAG TPA: hypothetical protein VK645_08980 [Chitinophagaceae bacterium]|nr:hypothetical protein [Chitinophagaceae bacterium]
MYTRLLLVLCSIVIVHTYTQAQVTPPEIRQTLPEKGIYRFPVFNEGSVVFRNGIISAARLNYNVSLDEMHFITEKGDTFSVADPATISFINLNGSRFYYDKGFLQTIDTAINNGITLAFKQGLTAQQQRKLGAYGITQPHEGIRTLTFYTGNGQTYKLGGDEKITVTAREYYFFGDAYGHFIKASKEYVLLHFEKHQAALKEFMKTNHTNFNVLKDLLKLMQFCERITS